MSWNDFIGYLKKKIIKLNEYSSQEEWELTPSAKEKYCQGLPQEEITDLGENLNFLLISHRQRFSLDNDFHKLPEIEKEEEESEEERESSDDEEENDNFNFSEPKKELKTWSEIFPDRESCKLGKSNSEAVSLKTYDLLGRIYEDWRLLGKKEKELQKKAKRLKKQSERVSGEWIKKQLAHEFYKEEGLKEELKAWLTDYWSLENEQQELLKEDYKKIKEDVENIEKYEADLLREEKSWFRKLDWKTIGVSAGIGVILILIVLVIRRYIKS